MERNRVILACVFFCALLSLLIASLLFREPILWREVGRELYSRWFSSSWRWHPLLDERLPRGIVLFCTGASLATAGAVMQSLFQNPLASPSTLGISAGGSLCVLLAFVFRLPHALPFALPLAAFVGTFAILGLVALIARSRGGLGTENLLLAGIAITTLLLAMQSVLMYSLRENWFLFRTLTEWEAGTIADRTWAHVHMQLPVALVGLYGCSKVAQELNLLALGEEEACHLGVPVQHVRWQLFFCISLLTAGSLAAAGNLPFFGLVFPHLLRQYIGPDNQRLLPLCILGGGTALLGMDELLRRADITGISMGNCFALVGGTLFIVLLFQRQTRLAQTR